MLVHIVCWKYKADTDPAMRASHIARLKALKALIDPVRTFEIGSDILHLHRSFDTGLVATFADEAGLEAYTVHSEHRKVAAFGKEISEQVVSVDFLV